LRRLFVVILLLSMLSIPTCVNALAPPQTPVQKQALFLSSLNATHPMGYYATHILSSLDEAGYNVTYLADGAVTIDLLLTQMNNYSVVIWRTDTVTLGNTTYWYVGQKSKTAIGLNYASNFASGQVTTNTGMTAVSLEFFRTHFGPDALQGVKLLIFEASSGNVVAPVFHAAGVNSVVFCTGDVTLQFGLVDDLTAALVGFLARGETVYNAVYDTLSPFSQGEPLNPLDSTFGIVFWYVGDGTATIAPAVHSAPFQRLHRP
jgi:hypothetical protein